MSELGKAGSGSVPGPEFNAVVDALGSKNPPSVPSITFTENTGPDTPAPGKDALFFDSADGSPKYVDDQGVEHSFGGAAAAGTPQMIGPFVVDYTDVPNTGDELELVTLPVGTAIINWWVEPESAVIFEATDPAGPTASSLALGQIAEFDPADPTYNQSGQWGYADFLNNDDADPSDLSGNVNSGDAYKDDGTVKQEKTTQLRFTVGTTPVRVVNTLGTTSDPYTAGHSEIYLLVVVPPIPDEL